MVELFIADVLMALTMFVVVPGFILFIASLYVEVCDAMDAMERKELGSRRPQGKE